MSDSDKDSNLISRAEFALSELKKIMERYHILYDDIYNLHKEYTNTGEPPPSVEVRLRASTLLFEHYFFAQTAFFFKESTELPPELKDKLIFSLNGNWLTHEMGQLLFSANTIFQLFSVRDTGLRRLQYDQDLPRTRKDVYDNAKLFYYLRPDEELKVKRIHFASPGEIELATQLSTLVPALKDAIIIITLASSAAMFVKSLPSIYRHYIQEIMKARQIIREDERRRIVHEFFKTKVKEEIPSNLKDLEVEQITSAMNILDSTTMKVTKEKILNPIRLTERTIKALSSLSQFFDKKKLSMGSANRDEDSSEQ